MRSAAKILSFLAAVSCIAAMTGCNNGNENDTVETSDTVSVSESVTSVYDDTEETISIYTGRAVENEEDLAIFKFHAELPEGYQVIIDNAEGKQYASENGAIMVKAQNFKEEFQDLAVFADQGCAMIKGNNMMYQSDTDFSEPMNTTVAGFDAIRYDYTVTSYIFLYETDSQGSQVTNEDGSPIITDEKEIYGEYVDRVYYFYSDEDVFYIICEAPKETAEAAAPEFDSFIESITITPPKSQ